MTFIPTSEAKVTIHPVEIIVAKNVRIELEDFRYVTHTVRTASIEVSKANEIEEMYFGYCYEEPNPTDGNYRRFIVDVIKSGSKLLLKVAVKRDSTYANLSFYYFKSNESY